MKEAPNDAAHEAHRQEHGDNRKCGGQYCQPDFSRAFERGSLVTFVAPVDHHASMTNDIFAHHDRVIDQ